MICSICGSDKITKSHRRGMEKLFKYVYPRAPYRCKECWSRFWIFENPFKTNSSKVIAGFAACVLIFLISWPFLPFNKKEPVKVEKKESTGSLFLTKRSETSKSELTSTDTQEQEDTIASYEDPQPAPIEDPLIKKNDIVESVPEDQPETTATSLNTDQSEKKTNTELETKSQFVEIEPLSTKNAESTLSKTSVDSPVPVKKQQVQKNNTLPSTKKASVPDKQVEQKTNQNIKPMLQFKGIKIVESEGSVDILLQTDKIIKKHKHFLLTDQTPPKIVIDLPGKWKHSGNTIFKAKSDIISRVRVGKHPDFFRIVLDMKTKKRLFPSFKESPEGLLIRVKH